MADQQTGPAERARKEYEAFEKYSAGATEQLVNSQGFAEALSMLASNVVALSRAAGIGAEQVVRMTRLAGRSDITRLGRQLARTEDKLEHVLQVVERLEDELATTRAERDSLASGPAVSAVPSPGAGKDSARAGRVRSASPSSANVAEVEAGR